MGTDRSRPASPRRIVFVCPDHETLLSETFLPLAAAVNARDGLSALLVLEPSSGGYARESCREQGVEIRLDPPESSANDFDPWTTTWQRVRGRFVRTRREIRRIEALVRELEPAVVVLPDDRTLLAMRWIRASERVGVRTLVVQWAAFYDAATTARIRAAAATATAGPARSRVDRFLGSLLGAIVGGIVPNAIRQSDGRRIWLVPPEITLAYRADGAFPRGSPWIYGGGNADRVAVFGEVWRDRQIADAVPPEKIVVTGAPQHDRLFEASRQRDAAASVELRRELDIDPESPIVTIMSPVFSFRTAASGRRDVSADELREDMTLVIETIRRSCPHATVVFKCHPRDRDHDFEFADRAGGNALRVVRRLDVARLVAASRLVLCQWSTTTITSLAMNTPVILFEFRDIPSNAMWNGARGPKRARGVRELERQLRAVDHDCAREELLEGRDAFLEKTIRFDGQSTRRLVDLIDELGS